MSGLSGGGGIQTKIVIGLTPDTHLYLHATETRQDFITKDGVITAKQLARSWYHHHVPLQKAKSPMNTNWSQSLVSWINSVDGILLCHRLKPFKITRIGLPMLLQSLIFLVKLLTNASLLITWWKNDACYLLYLCIKFTLICRFQIILSDMLPVHGIRINRLRNHIFIVSS